VSFPFGLHSAAVFDSHIPCRAHALPLPCSEHARSESDFSRSRHSTAGARHGMCELAWAVERRPVSYLPRFGIIRLLRGHSRSLLTKKLLPFGMCLIVLMTLETADYTEYGRTLKLKPVVLVLLCYVSIVYSFFYARHSRMF
jgi:hypothetical protein